MMTDPMAPAATDPMAPKPKSTLQAPQTAQTNPVPTAGATMTSASTASAPKPSDTTPSTPLGAADPLAFAQTPAPTPAPTAPAATATPAPSFNQTIANQPIGGANAPVMGQMSGPTDLLGRPVGADGVYHPFSGPTFTTANDGSGQVGTFQQPDGTWTNADGSALAPGTDQWGRSTFTGTGMQPMSTNGVANPNTGQPLAPVAASGMAPPGAASDASPSIPGGSSLAIPAPASGGGMANSASPAGPSSGAAFSTSPTTPGSDLRSQTITANSGLDRVNLAQRLIDNLKAQSEPAWQAKQRELTQNAAANGQLHSGMFRTSLGDAERQHELDLQNGDLGFLSDALKGSVDDNRFATGVAQQQQGFQEGQQNTAFGQQFAQQQLDEALRSGDFSRAMAMLTAGNAGNPGDVDMLLSQIFGGQASGANQALASAIGGRQANQTNQTQDDLYKQILASIYGTGGGVTQAGTPTQTDTNVWAD